MFRNRDLHASPLRIVLDEAAHHAFRIHIMLTASGLDVLRFGLRSQVHAEGADPETRERNVFLDIERPGALHHELERVALYTNPSLRFFELELEGDLQPNETLREIVLAPADIYLSDVAPGEGMAIGLPRIAVEQRPAVSGIDHFVPVRFPDRPLPPKSKNGKRDAVIFAWWTPDNAEAHKVGEHYLGLLKYFHPDSKIFVGINHGTDPRWAHMLEATGLDIEIRTPSDAFAVDSDTGGFLAALEAYHRYEETFDLVWFGHTKGASRASYDEYRWRRFRIERHFWSRRRELERIFDDPEIGIFAPRYVLTPGEERYTTNLRALQRIYQDRFAPLGLHAFETFFVLRDTILRAFCERVDQDFFAKGLEAFGGNRWFFEFAVPNIPTMQGYEPFIDLDVEGSNDPRSDASLALDIKQNHRLAIEELLRWRADPLGFRPRHIPWA